MEYHSFAFVFAQQWAHRRRFQNTSVGGQVAFQDDEGGVGVQRLFERADDGLREDGRM